MSTDHHAGLEDVEVLESSICEITQDQLNYRGYSVLDLAQFASFEEAVYLLWHSALPTQEQLSQFQTELRAEYGLPREIIEHINHVPREAHPMAVLRTLVSSLGLYDPEAGDNSELANMRKATRLLAKIPMIVAAIARHRLAKAHVDFNPELSLAGNFLHCMGGFPIEPKSVRVFETTLILYAEHELNASTFAARITAGTQAEIYSAIVAAIATLQGGLHGGANQKALEALLEIGKPEKVSEYVQNLLKKKERIMGFGHRVYKKGDPRVPILRKMCSDIAATEHQKQLFATAEALEKEMFAKKKLHANVDYYSGLAYYFLGLSADLYTCVFAIARTAGYVAHIIEQNKQNRLIRPRAVYTGKKKQKYIPISER